MITCHFRMTLMNIMLVSLHLRRLRRTSRRRILLLLTTFSSTLTLQGRHITVRNSSLTILLRHTQSNTRHIHNVRLNRLRSNSNFHSRHLNPDRLTLTLIRRQRLRARNQTDRPQSINIFFTLHPNLSPTRPTHNTNNTRYKARLNFLRSHHLRLRIQQFHRSGRHLNIIFHHGKRQRTVNRQPITINNARTRRITRHRTLARHINAHLNNVSTRLNHRHLLTLRLRFTSITNIRRTLHRLNNNIHPLNSDKTRINSLLYHRNPMPHHLSFSN